MNVFVNGRFLAQRRTGVQRYAFEILSGLDSLLAANDVGNLIEVTVLAPRNTPQPNLAKIRFRVVGPFEGHLWEQLTLPVVCGRTFLVGFGATGPVLKRNQVVTMHDAAVYAVPHAFGRAFRGWYRMLMPMLARRARYLMTVSEFAKADLLRHLGRSAEKARVSGEGWEHVLREPADAHALAKHRLRPGRYVLAVGSIAPHKNLAVVEQAARHLDPSLDVEIVVAGSVNHSIFGDTESRHGGRLRSIGYVSDSELRALYEHAAAFIHPSMYEGFGIPPLEAMALGCPVLASNAAAIPEVCGEGAWYFDPSDATGLAKLIARVLEQPRERDALVARGKARAQEHRWQKAAERFMALIMEEEARLRHLGMGSAASQPIAVDLEAEQTGSRAPWS